MQNIAGHRQQTFENKKLAGLTPYGAAAGYLIKSFLLYKEA